MHVVVQLDRRKIAELERAAERAIQMTAEALHTEVVQAQVIPRDTGHLQNEATYVDHQGDKSALVSNTPYAQRCYYHPEYRFQRTENPNARGEWLQPWIDGDKRDFVPETFQAFYRREAGL